MKVKGHDGKGNPVEFTPNEKPEIVLKSHIPSERTEGEAWWLEECKIESLDFQPNGAAIGKGFANNNYSCSGTVKIGRLRLNDDTKIESKNAKFSMRFEDCLDNNGMPDMKVSSFTFME